MSTGNIMDKRFRCQNPNCTEYGEWRGTHVHNPSGDYCAFCGSPFSSPQSQLVDAILGTTNNRDVKLSYEDRPYGLVLVGQTGFGKTSLMEHLISHVIETPAT